jgi:hypothetical protein
LPWISKEEPIQEDMERSIDMFLQTKDNQKATYHTVESIHQSDVLRMSRRTIDNTFESLYEKGIIDKRIGKFGKKYYWRVD